MDRRPGGGPGAVQWRAADGRRAVGRRSIGGSRAWDGGSDHHAVGNIILKLKCIFPSSFRRADLASAYQTLRSSLASPCRPEGTPRPRTTPPYMNICNLSSQSVGDRRGGPDAEPFDCGGTAPSQSCGIGEAAVGRAQPVSLGLKRNSRCRRWRSDPHDPRVWRVGFSDDGLATLAPLPERASGWRAFLDPGLAEDEHRALRAGERAGRPLGSDAFVASPGTGLTAAVRAPQTRPQAGGGR